jgi:hypothetical protein
VDDCKPLVPALDAEGMPFYDPEATGALLDELQARVAAAANPMVSVRRLPLHINDPKFAKALTAAFLDVGGGDLPVGAITYFFLLPVLKFMLLFDYDILSLSTPPPPSLSLSHTHNDILVSSYCRWARRRHHDNMDADDNGNGNDADGADGKFRHRGRCRFRCHQSISHAPLAADQPRPRHPPRQGLYKLNNPVYYP